MSFSPTTQNVAPVGSSNSASKGTTIVEINSSKRKVEETPSLSFPSPPPQFLQQISFLSCGSRSGWFAGVGKGLDTGMQRNSLVWLELTKLESWQHPRLSILGCSVSASSEKIGLGFKLNAQNVYIGQFADMATSSCRSHKSERQK
ncbi:predicted protein [Histoplasma capsulatum var. duboisii H88]|uniref:Predicted protein n=2 Tax=Ajellomyces capsulatus TaxID=5037 RepID=F0U955_AJEC8|nr:predicted protein [Histoplasma capsulatum H143]EGC41849.1 predicted protein [Histoplasma capsulatum var. duboisii H88]